MQRNKVIVMNKNTDTHNFIFVCLAAVIIVFSGAFIRLYREQMNLKIMISEGLMQVKEQVKTQAAAKVIPEVKLTHMFLMKNNVMMEQMNDAMILMKRDTTLTNGTIVSRTGTITKKDGTTIMLKNGEAIGVDGKMATK